MQLLNEIQKKLKAPKGQFNSFGKYHYRSCEDIVEAVKPLLGEGILTISDTMVEVGGRVYVKATATLSCKKEVVSVDGWAREALDRKGMDDSQITGATSSYARKYALNGLFLIDDTKDADTDAPKSDKPAYPVHTPKNDASGITDANRTAKTGTTATKTDEPGKARIKDLLEKMDHYPSTLAEAKETVLKLTNLEYKIENYDAIGDSLASLLEFKKA